MRAGALRVPKDSVYALKASSRASWHTCKMAGGREDVRQMSRSRSWMIGTRRGVQAAYCQIFRRSSGAKEENKEKVVGGGVDVSLAGLDGIIDDGAKLGIVFEQSPGFPGK